MHLLLLWSHISQNEQKIEPPRKLYPRLWTKLNALSSFYGIVLQSGAVGEKSSLVNDVLHGMKDCIFLVDPTACCLLLELSVSTWRSPDPPLKQCEHASPMTCCLSQHPDLLIADNTDSNIWHYTTMGSKFGLLLPITCLRCSFHQSSEASLS